MGKSQESVELLVVVTNLAGNDSCSPSETGGVSLTTGEIRE